MQNESLILEKGSLVRQISFFYMSTRHFEGVDSSKTAADKLSDPPLIC